MPSQNCFIGIDGGGTKTTAVIVDATGTEVARANGGTSNSSVIGPEAAASVVVDIINSAQSQVPGAAVLSGGWAGLSGFGRPSDHKMLRPLLEPLIVDLHLTNDIELVLAGLPGTVGVAVISGTGSIVAGRNAAGEYIRVGGWGHIFGDEGSGYGIGRDALKAISRCIDGRGPKTSLTKLIFHDLGITEPFDLISRIYHPSMDKAAIARLAKFPLDQAHGGDPVSIQIVDEAADQLADMVTTAARRLGFDLELPLALTGGNLLHILFLRERLLSRLREQWESVLPIIVVDPALAAARSLAGVWESSQ